MIEAVIFDMDGVLADTEYYYENRRKNFLLENGIPIPEGNFIQRKSHLGSACSQRPCAPSGDADGLPGVPQGSPHPL
jgi:beta-phosphoglucomutase-like phosphatase (HAD superfamily)